MADPTLVPESGDGTGIHPDRGSDATPGYPGAPRWVKVSALVALVLIVLLVIAMAIGGGEHGPGRHLPSGGADGDTAALAHRARGW